MSVAEIGGRYRIEHEIGRGGMGAVWSAFDERLQRRVAVKRMGAEHVSHPLARERFQHEALAVARLKNPHVVQIHDYGIDGDDVPYLVMELLDGEDLNARLHRLGKLPLPLIVPLVAQIGKALDAAHAAGIVHRDLKPDNVFLARAENGEETVKVLDFGLAALAASLAGDGSSGRSGTVLGTPSYMSPEQVRGSQCIDHRSDLWSLGVLAYRATTGHMPFSGDALPQLFVSVCLDTPEPPSRRSPDLGAELDTFFLRALAKDPAQRFQSGRALSAGLAAVLSPAAGTTKILVVDDEPDVVVLFKHRFRQQIRSATYELLFAANGEGALEALREHPDIDVVLTDIRMPGMDGLTFLARARERRAEVPVIVVSAFDDMTNIRTAMNRGGFDFLVKPIDFKDLEATIQKAIEHTRELRRGARSIQQNDTLRMFVGGALADRLRAPLAAPDSLGEEIVDATVVFLRVSGFDGATLPEAPDRAVRSLNANLEVVIPEVIVHGGIVEKLLGSTVIAVFQGALHAKRAQSVSMGPPAAPNPSALRAQSVSMGPPAAPNPSALRALEACVSVREQLQRLAAKTSEDSPYGHRVSAGIASGQILRGCVGSRSFSRLDYTMLGGVVATAAELAAQAADDEILVPQSLAPALDRAFELRLVRESALRGSLGEIQIFDVGARAVPPVLSSAQTVLVDRQVDRPESHHADLTTAIVEK